MKISEAMQKGWERVGHKQNFGEYFSEDGKKACALGCAYLGLNTKNKPNPFNLNIFDQFYKHLPGLTDKPIKCLPEIEGTTLFCQVYGSNDINKMSVPKIIKALKKCGL